MEPTLEERVKRLEDLLEKAISIADKSPMGKMFLKLLGV